ncbi:chorismate-binding protein [Gelidibacter maritimus]|uniref:Chorismate-binding protein n=1 Tax=Gelidibacter maritimus TaxID=2761487 RepID=A0A7W2M6L0_9FLAO|nr:chorismate-binding protein [Gelidibacter maritimus]MBA6153682.1 chorismate-binding protein [Gelidibacter maritimus]
MNLDQFFEKIKKQYDRKLPFVVYKKPSSSKLKCMLQATDVLHAVVDFTESGFVFAPFDSSQDAFIVPIEHAEIVSVEFDKNDFSKTERKNHKTSDMVDSHRESEKLAHINQVKNGITAIEEGCFSKVVLSRRELVANVENHPIEIFKRLLQRYPPAFVYCWYHPKVGLWLGATPETLLNIKGHQLHTMSLAGTQAFEGTVDVVWKEKEKEEQQIVTDFIVESLRESVGNHRSTTDLMTVTDQKTVRAGNLLHLQTEISMRLTPENKDLKPILEALHPTPAVCGFPKDKAKAYIVENEGYPREFYAGFMGELHLKETISRNPNRRNVENNAYRVQKSVSNLYVNLRCMQIKGEDVFIYVGGGITKDSNPTAEWEETVHKSKIIKSVL